MTKTELLKFIREQQLAQDAWITSIPREISEAFFDNPHVDSLHKVNDILMKQVFEEAYEDAYWFLYEWKPCAEGVVQIREEDGTEWSFHDESSFYRYFKKVCNE